jgi:DMSO/TMAO reductase YedYZ molybdopterin-dependent catalytic subunit
MPEDPRSSVPVARPADMEQVLSRVRWRSPLRGPWLTSVFGLALLVGIPIEFATGLLSYAAYNPRISGNDPIPHHGILGSYLFDWATNPVWLYRLIEGVHIALGLALVPILLAKLWSVIPKLFAWPPVRSVAHLLERLSLVLLVGGAVFEFSTGILNIDYLGGAYGFSFYTGHFYGAWAFMAGFTTHVVLKFGRMVRALRSRKLRTELRTGVRDTGPEPVDDELVAPEPARATMSRRGVLALVGGTSLTVLVLTVGGTTGGVLRRLALFSTRGESAPGVGPNHFPVNHTAASAGIRADDVGPAWRLELAGMRQVTLSRDALLAMPLTTAKLPIACTEGWSTVQTWTGVPLIDLAVLAGVPRPGRVILTTISSDGKTILSGAQIRDWHSMLALRVNGADLSLDHGYPARVIVPAAPGTYNRKWLRRMTFVPEA